MEKVCVRVFLGGVEAALYHYHYLGYYHYLHYYYTLNAWASIDAVVTLYFHCSRCSCCGLPAAPSTAAGQPL